MAGGGSRHLHLLGAEALGRPGQAHGITFSLAVHVAVGRLSLGRLGVLFGGVGVAGVGWGRWGEGLRAGEGAR